MSEQVLTKKSKCGLCTTAVRPAPKSVGALGFMLLSVGIALIAFSVMYKLGIFPFMGGLLASFCGVILLLVFVGENGISSVSLYHFFDSNDSWHHHKEDPTKTPKQFWEDGSQRPVILVRYTGWFGNDYGIFMHEKTSWAYTDSWGGRVTLRGHNGVIIDATPPDALRLLETSERGLRELCAKHAEQDGFVSKAHAQAEELRSEVEQLTAQSDCATESLFRIQAWLQWPERKRSRWKHAAALKRLIKEQIIGIADVPEAERAAWLNRHRRDAGAWAERYEQMQAHNAREIDPEDRAAANVRAAVDVGEPVVGASA